MAAELTGLRAPRPDPPPHVCAACGSTRDACRGFPNDVWYCAPCVPPELRFPWEPGHTPPAAPAETEPARPTAQVVPFPARPARPAPATAAESAPDLFGPVPA